MHAAVKCIYTSYLVCTRKHTFTLSLTTINHTPYTYFQILMGYSDWTISSTSRNCRNIFCFQNSYPYFPNAMGTSLSRVTVAGYKWQIFHPMLGNNSFPQIVEIDQFIDISYTFYFLYIFTLVESLLSKLTLFVCAES